MGDTRYPKRMYYPLAYVIIGAVWLGGELNARGWGWFTLFPLMLIAIGIGALRETIITHTVENRMREWNYTWTEPLDDEDISADELFASEERQHG